MAKTALLLVLAVAVAGQDDTDFRRARWGMTAAEVIEAEGRQPDARIPKNAHGVSELHYEVTVNGLAATAGYVFKDGFGLTYGGYRFRHRQTASIRFLDEFEDLEALLEKKYGAPDELEVVWADDLYKDSPQDWGTAVALGHLTFRTWWRVPVERPDTAVMLSLTGDEGETRLSISYQWINEELQRATEQTVLDDL